MKVLSFLSFFFVMMVVLILHKYYTLSFLFLAILVCSLTLWRAIHVSKHFKTFVENLLTKIK